MKKSRIIRTILGILFVIAFVYISLLAFWSILSFMYGEEETITGLPLVVVLVIPLLIFGLAFIIAAISFFSVPLEKAIKFTRTLIEVILIIFLILSLLKWLDDLFFWIIVPLLIVFSIIWARLPVKLSEKPFIRRVDYYFSVIISLIFLGSIWFLFNLPTGYPAGYFMPREAFYFPIAVILIVSSFISLRLLIIKSRKALKEIKAGKTANQTQI